MDIRTHYYKCENDVSDKLAPTQTLAEQSVYRRLYRLSYGFRKDTCRVGMGALAEACNITSRNTIKKAISGLVKKKHIAITAEAKNNSAGTEYRIFRPYEIFAAVSKIDGAELDAARSTPSKNDIAAVSKIAVAKNDRVKEVASERKRENVAVMGISGSLAPSIIDIANSTVSKTAVAKNDHIKEDSLKDILSPDPVLYFYICLGQKRVSGQQRGKGTTVLRKLKKDGFTIEEIQYAIEWTTTSGNTPEQPYDFGIIPHTIGKALSARSKAQEAADAAQKEAARVSAAEEERRRLQGEIQEMRTRMAEDELADLREKALKEIRNTDGIKEQFINEPLITAKENEILQRGKPAK